jgi:nitrogen fixation protein NifQ
MSRPIRSLPDAKARFVAALPPLAEADGAALAALFSKSVAGRRDPFLTEIFSRLLAIAIMEAREEGSTLDGALGLSARDLGELAVWIAHPLAARYADEACDPIVDDEEEQVRALLSAHAVDGSREARWLAAMVARRAMRANHLWQDLGLADRSWLNELLRRYFPELHAGNTADMKWKKYFYRRLCEMEGFVLCTAPSCRECCDFDRCFGAEDGESLLAQRRRATETANTTAPLSDS